VNAVTYKGLQVPWVTRWTGEIAEGQKVDTGLVNGELRVSYADGIEVRDDRGVLWQREGIDRKGEPQFAQVSAHRQRAAMRKGLCQVCGERITDRPIRWLMSAHQLTPLRDGTALTFSPPTCSGCVDVALKACPHLRTNDRLILRVLEYRIWGVWGDMARIPPETVDVGPDTVLQVDRRVYINYDRPDLAAAIAKQQVVQLLKYAIEKEVEPQ
jgi:hypothetical protein